MRLLHLSDFHWDKKREFDQNILLSALTEDAELLKHKGRIDALIFSGDLVWSGNTASNFKQACTALIDPLLDLLDIPDSRVYICAGNHDVATTAIDEITESGMSATLSSTEKLNNFIDKNNLNRSRNDKRLENFFKFREERFHKEAKDRTPHYDTIIARIDDIDVGFAIFNTAWRSTGAGPEERHKLLLGERSVDAAIASIKNTSLKIAVLHHPLDWLAAWDQTSVEIPLMSGFDVILFGHVHVGRPSVNENPLGKAVLLQSGALYTRRDYFNGFAIIDLDFTGNTIDVQSMTWMNTTRRFAPAYDVSPSAGVTRFQLRKDTQESGLPLKAIQALREAIRTRADAHVQASIPEQNVSFDEVFSTLPIAEKPEIEISKLGPNKYKKALVGIESLVGKPGVVGVFGEKESGKTMLSLKIAKACVNSSGRDFRIPIFTDFNDLARKDYQTTSLAFLVRKSNAVLEFDYTPDKILNNHRCLFIVDNANYTDEAKLKALKAAILAADNQHDFLILFSHLTYTPQSAVSESLGGKLAPFFILSLTRSNLRESVTRLPIQVSLQSLDETVIRTITSNHLPRTHYMATLVALAVKNNRLSAVINEATLVENFVDIVLKKGDPSQLFRGPTDFRGQQILLKNIAFWLDQEEPVYENEFLAKITTYYMDRGIKTGSADVMRRFVEVGLLEIADGEVGFRFPVIASYFLASYATKDPLFMTKMFQGSNITKYHRDIDFLVDLLRSDPAILLSFEELVAANQPETFKQARRGAFLDDDIGTNDRMKTRLTVVQQGPKTQQEIDMQADFAERAFRQSFDPTAGKENSADSILRLVTYLLGYTGWGRAISSLDFTELSLRKPSYRKLLSEWDALSSFIASNATAFEREFSARKSEAPVPEELTNISYFLRVQTPIVLAKFAFRIPGLESVHDILNETFDDEPHLVLSERVGIVIMLIHNRPKGWENRVAQVLKQAIKDKTNSVIKIIAETCATEYQYTPMDGTDRGALEGLLADVICFMDSKVDRGRLIANFKQRRTLVETQIAARDALTSKAD